jgi:hypothetical protein
MDGRARTYVSCAFARILARIGSPTGDSEPIMDESDFEGTLVLEQLAAIGRVEEFFDAIDADDVERAKMLMKNAQIDAPTIAMVVKKMEASDGEH